MDFREVCEFFGGTIFYEELRGNLHDLSASIDSYEHLPEHRDADSRAAGTLLRVVHRLYSGNFRSAQQLLTSLLNDNQYSNRWKFRAYTYTILFHTWKHSPPAFRFSSPLRGPSMVVWEITHNQLDISGILRVCNSLRQYAKPIDLLEYNLIQELWHISSRGLEMTRSLNPAYEYYDNREPAILEAYRAELSECMQRLTGMQLESFRLEMPLVSAYIDRLLYELSYSEGLEDATRHLDSMKAKYEDGKDVHGLGLYELLKEDAVVSSPFTTPLVLNLHLADSWDKFGGNSDMYQGSGSVMNQSIDGNVSMLEHLTLDDDGAPVSLSDRPPCQVSDECRVVLERVDQRYEAAKKLFDEAKSPRALATIYFRRAALLRLCSLSPAWIWNPQSTCRDKESSLLTAACNMFHACGDEQNHMLAQIQTFLHEGLGIHKSDIGRNIRKSTSDTENHVFVAHLGLLALRLGHYFRYVCGCSSLSNDMYENARILFHDLTGFRVAWFQVWLARISLFVSLNDFRTAKLGVEQVKEAFGPMTGEILQLGAKTRQLSVIQRIVGIAMHFGRLVGEALLAVYPNFSGTSTILIPEMEKIFTVLLSMDSEKWYASSLGPWIAQQRQCLRHLAAISECRRFEQEGDLRAAQSVLIAYMNPPPNEVGYDLAAKIYRINVSLSCGETTEANRVLARITDDETFAQYLPPDLDWLPKQQLQLSLWTAETIFLACIRAGSWDRAEKLMKKLDELLPAYFTSVSGYTEISPWQRCFYAGLVAEKRGHTQLAMLYFVQSNHFFEVTRGNLMTPYERRAMASHPDFGRLTNSIARMTLLAKDENKQSQGIHEPRTLSLDRRIFTMFRNEVVDYSTLDAAECDADTLEMLEWNKAMIIIEGVGSPGSPATDLLLKSYRYELWLELRSLARPMKADELSEFMELHNEFNGKEFSFERSAKPPLTRLSQLLDAIPPHTLVIYTSLSTDGLALFAMDQGGIKHASWNSRLTIHILRVYVLACWHLVTYESGRNRRENTYETIETISALLLAPIVEHIESKDDIVFVPSGDLVRLPFHALVYKGFPLGL